MIKKISATATYPLRQLYLRPGRPESECVFAGDENSLTAHFGAFKDDQLVGILTITPEREARLSLKGPWRMRGLAVSKQYRGQKIASELCLAALDYARTQGGEIWWAYARPSSLKIFINLGGRQIGEPFEIANIGLHYLITGEL